MLYKAINTTQIFERYINHISQIILNLHIYIEKGKGQKENKENAFHVVSTLDDIMILFGY